MLQPENVRPSLLSRQAHAALDCAIQGLYGKVEQLLVGS